MARRRQVVVTDSFGPRFYLFSQLPPELRLILWSFSLPESRIVTIRCGARWVPGFQGHLNDGQSIQCSSPSPVPTNLHVCRESRFEALGRYKLLFGLMGQPGTIYFDPLRDTLYFGARDGFASSEAHLNTFMAMISPSDRAFVRHIAVNEIIIRSRDSFDRRIAPTPQQITERLVCEIRARFRNLEQLTFVYNDRNPIYSSDSIFVELDPNNRLFEGRIKNAIEAIMDRYPSFNPPSWKVKAIATGAAGPIYDQGVLGYKGRRSYFFRPYLGAKRFWSSRQCACTCCGYSRQEFRLPSAKNKLYIL
ncbi:hypothetical protein HD806DRAFT_44544 [Xylariaceae sp. AK1471]|nr:hypothetical protein HD806DRAFT_44544 [Xylariaceae sp. AK1471]